MQRLLHLQHQPTSSRPENVSSMSARSAFLILYHKIFPTASCWCCRLFRASFGTAHYHHHHLGKEVRLRWKAKGSLLPTTSPSSYMHVRARSQRTVIWRPLPSKWEGFWWNGGEVRLPCCLKIELFHLAESTFPSLCFVHPRFSPTKKGKTAKTAKKVPYLKSCTSSNQNDKNKALRFVVEICMVKIIMGSNAIAFN